MNLFKIEESIQNFLEQGFDNTCIDQETGEILEERIAERLDNLEFTFNIKAENLALYIKNLKAEESRQLIPNIPQLGRLQKKKG